MSEKSGREERAAWLLWEALQEISSLIWERYEPEFIERCLAEEQPRPAGGEDSYSC